MVSLIVCSLLTVPNQARSVEQTVRPPIVQERKLVTYLPIPVNKPLYLIKSRTRFAKGWCTSYVASRVKVTWSGNARQWATNATKQGLKVGPTPKKGDIYVTSKENSKSCPNCGHVAYVEQVKSGKILISEMNYVGFGVVSQRWLSTSDLVTKQASFIHMGVIL